MQQVFSSVEKICLHFFNFAFLKHLPFLCECSCKDVFNFFFIFLILFWIRNGPGPLLRFSANTDLFTFYFLLFSFLLFFFFSLNFPSYFYSYLLLFLFLWITNVSSLLLFSANAAVQMNKNGLIKVICEFSILPKKGLYHLKMLPNNKLC